MEYNNTEYRARIQFRNGKTQYPVTLIDFSEDMLDRELWVNKSWGAQGVVKINDANIPEEDLYYLGFQKIVGVDKVETFVNVTKLY